MPPAGIPAEAVSFAQTVFWSATTLGSYLFARRLYRRWPRPWLNPVALAPALLILALHASYARYLAGAGWLLAGALGLNEQLRLSLLARSISTPFAITVAQEIGGRANLTAVFVILTGLVGATLGEYRLTRVPLQSDLARGSQRGMGAHALGTAKGLEIDRELGAIAGLVMVLAGVVNVLAAPLLAWLLR